MQSISKNELRFVKLWWYFWCGNAEIRWIWAKGTNIIVITKNVKLREYIWNNFKKNMVCYIKHLTTIRLLFDFICLFIYLNQSNFFIRNWWICFLFEHATDNFKKVVTAQWLWVTIFVHWLDWKAIYIEKNHIGIRSNNIFSFN